MDFTPLNDIGFPEFTTKLIKDTFDTLISANINQMEAYSELLSETSKTLTQYTNDNYKAISYDEIYDFLSTIQLDTALPATDTLTNGNATNVNNATSFLPVNGTSSNIISWPILNSGSSTTHPETNLVTTIHKNDSSFTLAQSTPATIEYLTNAVAKYLATAKYNALQSLVKMGLLRLVVTRGEIEARLDYKTYKSEYATSMETNVKNKSFGAGATGSYDSSAKSKGISKLFKIAGSANYSSVRVSTSASVSSSSSAQSISIMGRVLLEFKTDYQPLSN